MRFALRTQLYDRHACRKKEEEEEASDKDLIAQANLYNLFEVASTTCI
jgi:hypothetical protein